MKRLYLFVLAPGLLPLAVCFAAQAQRPSDVVKWSATITGATSNTASATLSATIQDGWHVYALSQPSGGPTPLRINIPSGGSFTLAGPVVETKVIRHFDPNFNMETVYYLTAASFNLELKGTVAAANESILVDVRFQACSDRLCLPPFTAHVTAERRRR
jgi:hypothetical protein